MNAEDVDITKRESIKRFASDNFKSSLKKSGLILEKSEFAAKLGSIEYGITTTFPGYKTIETGDFKEDELVAMFFDIRESTTIIAEYGKEAAYAILYALIPTIALIIAKRDGFIADYTGDGIMAIWGFENEQSKKKSMKTYVTKCIDTGWLIKRCVENIINPLLQSYAFNFQSTNRTRLPDINFGIGISHGRVVITKFQLDREDQTFQQTKVIGPCVSFASKFSGQGYSGGFDEIIIGLDTLDLIPNVRDGEKGKYSIGRSNKREAKKVVVNDRLCDY